MAYEPIMVPPKNPQRRRTVLVVIGVVLSLCCLGGVVGGFVLRDVFQQATGPARDTVDTFAEAMIGRDYPTAYGQLCGQLRNRQSQADFAREQAEAFTPTDYEIVGLSVVNNNGRLNGRADVRWTLPNGTSGTQVLTLVKEDGDWRICG
ncbi:hypothetical protein D7147_24730 [Micromonospora musae]|uniref:DUF4878 domain-containing protein n=1 Tax=Micromonospora musae TaxID=1894970 RepID=A0A3A9XUN1_9ACTN|nr:hypothetical protein [Micromonospora musae]RKN15682.1 hypothetical protein D7147_24730 [Micromonospora musae]RKN29120.1 hypothetical protein D7044_23190 [Micromonospora musae]